MELKPMCSVCRLVNCCMPLSARSTLLLRFIRLRRTVTPTQHTRLRNHIKRLSHCINVTHMLSINLQLLYASPRAPSTPTSSIRPTNFPAKFSASHLGCRLTCNTMLASTEEQHAHADRNHSDNHTVTQQHWKTCQWCSLPPALE